MRKFILLTTTILFSLLLNAQIRGNNVTVLIQPDHQDWTYKTGETAKFSVQVLASSTPINNVEVYYEAGPEMYPDVKKTVTLKDGTMTWKGSMKQPGFYRLKVTAKVNGKSYDGMCTAAFSPEKIKATTTDAKNFDSFWSKAIEDARKVPLDPRVELLADRCTDKVNAYQVSFQNIRNNSRTYGILCVPKKEGTYPALLRVPGAGCRPYSGDTWIAGEGCITLEIGVHGIPVNMDQSVYDNLHNGALDGYWDSNLEDPDRNYYKRVVIGCIRAVDYIATLPQWNGERLGVTGSSQGGFLSLATAALDKRVTCYGSVHAALCDFTGSLQGKPDGWPHYFYWDKNPSQKRIEGSRYYDGVNFARRITCPGWFSFGYNDDVVPPTTAWGTYNSVTAQKEIHPYQQTGHFWYQEQWDEWNAWLMEQLQVGYTGAAQLENRLRALSKKGYMFGHQDDPMYGLSWQWDRNRSDVLELTGDYPAIMGFDLGGIEMGDGKNLDSVPFTRIREELMNHYNRGGIVTLSWHPRNPLTGGTAWDITNKNTVKSILPGGECHEKFRGWMQRVADFIKTLKTDGGVRVPIIFRPWHENAGSWFWWGWDLCTDDEYKGLWNMLQDYLNKEGLDNLLWSYSPSQGKLKTADTFMRRYPGNDRVQLLGVDAYQWGTEDEFKAGLSGELDFLKKFAGDNNKMYAVTECGYKNIPDATWWTRVFKPIVDKYEGVVYVLPWRNDVKEYFAPDKNQTSAADFKKFVEAGNVMMLKDITNKK